MFSQILQVGSALIDKLFPDPIQKKEAQAKLLELEQKGEIADIELAFKNIQAEANSDDKFTKRARPSFMYLFYIIILFAIPMGIISAIDQEMAIRISTGLTSWWSAIPDEMWWLFGVGFTGYSAFRSIDKIKRKT